MANGPFTKYLAYALRVAAGIEAPPDETDYRIAYVTADYEVDLDGDEFVADIGDDNIVLRTEPLENVAISDAALLTADPLSTTDVTSEKTIAAAIIFDNNGADDTERRLVAYIDTFVEEDDENPLPIEAPDGVTINFAMAAGLLFIQRA